MIVSRGSKVASGLHNHTIQETLPHSSSTRPQILVLLLSSSSPTLAKRSGIPRWSEDVVSCEQRRDAHPWVQWSGQRRYTRRLRCCCSRWHVGGGGMSGSIGRGWGVSSSAPLVDLWIFDTEAGCPTAHSCKGLVSCGVVFNKEAAISMRGERPLEEAALHIGQYND